MTTNDPRAHIDAETLAAWADHGLSAETAATVELHLSNCDRCQEMLAAFVRSDVPAGAAILPFWSRRPVQWSSFGLAAAAAIAAMIWIGRPPSAPMPEATVAMQDAAAVAPPTAAPATVDQLSSAPSRLEERQAKPGDNSARRQDSAAASQQKLTRQVQELAKKDVAAAAPTATAVASMPPVPAPVAMAPPPPPTPAASVPTPVPQSAPVTVSAASPVAATEAIVMAPPIEILAPDQRIGLASRSATGGAGRGGGAGGGRALASELPAPGQIRWRIVAGSLVQRSQDSGATWTGVEIEPDLKARLLAGVATSPVNCWLVGIDGVVLVTTDGRTFRRVPVPEPVRLISVIAQDPLRATVTASDGRTFSTVDGGKTWK